MTWVIKILNRDYQKTSKAWVSNEWLEQDLGIGDFMINDFQFSESTWREVEYEKVEKEQLVNKENITSTKILTTTSPRFQILTPLIEEVVVVIPSIPKYNVKYIIKNNSEINNKLLIKEKVGGPVIFSLDSRDEYASLFHDKIEWHIKI